MIVKFNEIFYILSEKNGIVLLNWSNRSGNFPTRMVYWSHLISKLRIKNPRNINKPIRKLIQIFPPLEYEKTQFNSNVVQNSKNTNIETHVSSAHNSSKIQSKIFHPLNLIYLRFNLDLNFQIGWVSSTMFLRIVGRNLMLKTLIKVKLTLKILPVIIQWISNNKKW